MKKLLLIDGSGLIYRAFYAFVSRPLMTSKGENTSAIFGFLRMLFKLIREQKPDAIAVAFDSGRDTFRKEKYEKYKAQRLQAPDDLKKQIPAVEELLKAMNIPVYAVKGFEADDIIATLSNQAVKNGWEVVIVSSDKDLLQLVNGNIKVIAPTKGISETITYDRNTVVEKWSVPPERIVDLLALMGDSSDNVPGVKGIGEKTAKKLLSEYGSLDNLYRNLENIKGSVKKKLEEGKELAELSRELVKVRTDVPVEFQPTDFDESQIKNEKVYQLLARYELKSLIREIFGSDKPNGISSTEQQELTLFPETESNIKVETAPPKYELITETSSLKKLVNQIKEKGFVSIDTETTAIHPIDADLIGVSVSVLPGTGFYIPLAHKDAGTDFTKAQALKMLAEVVESESVKKIGQNIKYDYQVLKLAGIQMKGIYFDTMIASYVINPTRKHNLDALAEEFLGYKTMKYRELVGRTDIFTLLSVPVEKVKDYSAEDADIALRLKGVLEPRIKNLNLETLFWNIEMPVVEVLAEMELEGVRIDTEYLKKMSEEVGREIEEIRSKIYDIAGMEFNINSHQQLAYILFEKLKLPPVKKTQKTKSYSTSEDVLKTLSSLHPLPALILRYRTLSKLKSTYIDELPQMIKSKTGRVHTSFNQTITATGRLSSSNPNLQNIPVRDELGKRIRKAFVAEEGRNLISADYSQIELRVLAHLSGDEKLSEAFMKGEDIHRKTASLIFGVSESEITPQQRRIAKVVNFGVVYGMSPHGLAEELGISHGEARKFIEQYFSTYEGVRRYIEETLEKARRTGFVETMFGRRRYIPELKGRRGGKLLGLSAPERIAINTPIQGTAADIMKIAMRKVFDKLKGKSARMILQIHDELVIEVEESQTDEIRNLVKSEMEQAVNLNIPLIVDTGTGKTWADAHE